MATLRPVKAKLRARLFVINVLPADSPKDAQIIRCALPRESSAKKLKLVLRIRNDSVTESVPCSVML